VVSVVTEGEGNSRALAIQQALVEAISRVNGKTIDSNQSLNLLSKTLSLDQDIHTLTTEDFKNKVKSATHGIVQGYKVIQGHRQNNGQHLVELEVNILKYQLGKSSKRKRIAVLPFHSNIQDGAKLKGKKIDPFRVSRLLTQGLVSYLVQTRKFSILDRENSPTLKAEKVHYISRSKNVSELVKLGQEISADFILVGAVENLESRSRFRKSRTSDRVLPSPKINIEIAYRLIDVTTTQIKSSQLFSQAFGSELFTKSFNLDTALAKEVSHKIGQKILYSIYPIAIVGKSGKYFILNQGGETLSKGDHFEIYQKGQLIIDEYTNEALGAVETKVGKLAIQRVQSKMAYAEVLSSEYDLFLGFKKGLFIVRPIKYQTKQTLKSKIKSELQQKKKATNGDDFWDQE